VGSSGTIRIYFTQNQHFFDQHQRFNVKLAIFAAILQYFLNIIMKTGKVKFFNESKGFGFIKDSESDKEFFVHVSGLVDQIRENDDVTFELQEGRKGLNAVNVKLA
jgi:CspA family cold shock protein